MGTRNLIIISGILLASSDRQGLYILLYGIVFITSYSVLFREKIYLKIVKPLISAAAISLVYSLLIAPILIKLVIGHYPDLTYHKIDMGLIKPIFFRFSTLYTLDTVKYFFGNINRVVAMFIIFIILCRNMVCDTDDSRKRIKYALLFLISLFSILILNTLMILKHNAIPLEEVRRVYYSLPFTTIILLYTLWVTSNISKAYPKTIIPIILFLGAIFTLNIFSLNEHIKIVTSGLLREEYSNKGQIIQCIQSKQSISSFQISEAEKDFCKLLR